MPISARQHLNTNVETSARKGPKGIRARFAYHSENSRTFSWLCKALYLPGVDLLAITFSLLCVEADKLRRPRIQ